MELDLNKLTLFLKGAKNTNLLKYDKLSDYPLIKQLSTTDETTAADTAADAATVTIKKTKKNKSKKNNTASAKALNTTAETTITEVATVTEATTAEATTEATAEATLPQVLSISAIDKPNKKKIRQIKNKSESMVTITDLEFNMFKPESKCGESNKYMIYIQNNTSNTNGNEYSGIVMDVVTQRPLSIPPPPFNKMTNNTSIKLVDKYLKDELYDIIKIEDGTIITLYSWIHPQNGIMWSMSSNHGYDVSSYKWMGGLTYAEVFYDLVNRLYPSFKELTGMDIIYINHTDEVKTYLTFTNLDTKYCYSMGFRHHNFHPLKLDSEKIWQIQYVDLSTPNPQIIYGGKFPSNVLPEHEKYNYSYFSKDIVTKSIIEIKCISSFTNACILINSNHVEKSIIKDNDDSDPEIEEKNPYFQYGFILRSKDRTQTGIYSDIIIKSLLLKIVETMLYKYHSDYKLYVNHNNRMEYIAMRAFLKTGKDDILTSHKQQFIALFPEWSEKFFAFETLISSIVDKIKLKYNKVTNTTNAETDMDKFINNMYRIIKKEYAHITKDYDNIIRNYIINPEYALIYLHLDM